jgi:uncharacterized membrane protein
MIDLIPFEQMREAMNDPQRVHAATVHLPIAAAVIGLAFVIILTLTGGKWGGLRWTTVILYALGALGAFAAMQTGEDAEAALSPKPTGEIHDLIHKHEELAEFFWIGLAATGVLTLLTFAKAAWFRSLMLLLALLAGAATVVWAGGIGHYGGELVYRHGVGVGQAPPVQPESPDKKPDVEVKKPDAKVEVKKPDKPEKPADPNKVPGERDLPEPKTGGKTIFDP